jgi:2'-5' RNA ligase
VRCFVAVGGETDLGAALGGWLGRTRERFPELSVTPASNLHLTLAFLGELDAGQVEAASAAVEATAAGAGSPWELGWGEPGAFPGARRPRVLWLGPGAGSERLVAAQEVLAGELQGRGLPVDPKPYRPHLTLARVRKPPLGRERAAEVGEWLASMPSLPALAVDSVVLYQSRLGKPAAVHTPITTAELG